MFLDHSFSRRSGKPGVRALVIVFLALTLLAPGAALGYQLPIKGNHPDDMEHDLASMTLRPDEYEIDDLAATDNYLMGPAWFAEYLAAERGVDPDDLADEFDDAGLMAVFLSLAAIPSDDDPDAYGIMTQSTSMEFEEEEGAEAGFELMQIDDPDAEVLDDPEIGDESILLRLEADVDGQEYVWTELVFRVENIVGVVDLRWIDDAMESDLEEDEIATLASEMEDRVEAALDGETSALVMKLLRLDGTDDYSIRTDHDAIDVEDGEYVATYDEPEELAESVGEFWEDTGVVDLHRVAISFEPADDPDDPGAVYLSRIYKFGSRRDARAFIGEATAFFTDDDVSGGYSDFEPVDDLPDMDFDGEVAVIGYAYDFGGDQPVVGYRVWLQVDAYVVSMEADSLNGVDLDALLGLLDEQADCVEDDGYCQPIAVPEDLFN